MPRRRYNYRTYAEISAGIAIIAGFNYVFSKLWDKLYANFDIGSVIGLGILIVGFIFGFALYLRIFDRKGTIARMLGAGKEESETGSLSSASRTPLHKWLAYAALALVMIDIVAGPFVVAQVLAQNSELQTGYFAIAGLSLALILASFVEFRFFQMDKKLEKILEARRKANELSVAYSDTK